MACGICGQPGHNRRTCSAGGGGGGGSSYLGGGGNYGYSGYSSASSTSSLSSIYSNVGTSSRYDPPTESRRTVHCGICGQPGHNRRTCSAGGGGGGSSYSGGNHGLSSASSTSGLSSIFSLDTTPKYKPPSETRRTVHCGICGEAGHNRRTCTAGSSSTNDIPSRSSISASTTRTVTCGICGKPGHNRRTCGELQQASEKSTSEWKPTATKRTVTCGICRKPGHNSRTCERRSTEGNATQEISSKRTVTCGTCGKPGHNSRSCADNTSKGASSASWDATKTRRTVKCGICGQPGHNRRTCSWGHLALLQTEKGEAEQTATREPEDEDWEPKYYTAPTWMSEPASSSESDEYDEDSERSSVSSETDTDDGFERREIFSREFDKAYKSLSKALSKEVWMHEDVRGHFLKGPKKTDVEGEIYMLRLANPTKEEEFDMYKIGRSTDSEKRIRELEAANNEEYESISFETLFHMLAESAVHMQLKEERTPRDFGDGKSEWFTGDAKKFEDTIRLVVQVIEDNYEDLNAIRHLGEKCEGAGVKI